MILMNMDQSLPLAGNGYSVIHFFICVLCWHLILNVKSKYASWYYHHRREMRIRVVNISFIVMNGMVSCGQTGGLLVLAPNCALKQDPLLIHCSPA